MKTRDERFAWAIDTRSDEGHGFLGIWFMDPKLRPEPFRSGNTTALFRTRAQARTWLKQKRRDTYQAFPKMAVTKVRIVVEAT